MLLPLPQGCSVIGKPRICTVQLCTRERVFAASGWLATARTREASRQKLCCGPTPEEPPKALQTSECDELLDLTITSCVILVKRQPGKFIVTQRRRVLSAARYVRRNACKQVSGELMRRESLFRIQKKSKPSPSAGHLWLQLSHQCRTPC